MVFGITEFLLWAIKKSCSASPHLRVFIHKPKGRREKGEGNPRCSIWQSLYISDIILSDFHTNPMTCYYSHFIDEKLKLREVRKLNTFTHLGSK